MKVKILEVTCIMGALQIFARDDGREALWQAHSRRLSFLCSVIRFRLEIETVSKRKKLFCATAAYARQKVAILQRQFEFGRRKRFRELTLAKSKRRWNDRNCINFRFATHWSLLKCFQSIISCFHLSLARLENSFAQENATSRVHCAAAILKAQNSRAWDINLISVVLKFRFRPRKRIGERGRELKVVHPQATADRLSAKKSLEKSASLSGGKF